MYVYTHIGEILYIYIYIYIYIVFFPLGEWGRVLPTSQKFTHPLQKFPHRR